MIALNLDDLIEIPDERAAALKSNGVRVENVFRGIEEGEPLDELARRFGVTASELLAVFAHATLGPAEKPTLRLVRGKPASRQWTKWLSESALKKILPNLSAPSRLALSSGMLQALDLWDESHDAAQDAEDRGESYVSAYWHGIAHRREPDAGNATYWFRRVGAHPVFKPLADAIRPLSDQDSSIAARLVPGGVWNPFAFIQLTSNAGPEFEHIAMKIQRKEISLLLAASMASIS